MSKIVYMKLSFFFILISLNAMDEKTSLLTKSITLGNRILVATEIKTMAQEQQDLLYETTTPSCCFRLYGIDGKKVIAEHHYQQLKKYENMKNLEIKRIQICNEDSGQYPCCNDKAIVNCKGGCAGGTMIGIMGFIATYTFCGVSPEPFYMMLSCLIGGTTGSALGCTCTEIDRCRNPKYIYEQSR